MPRPDEPRTPEDPPVPHTPSKRARAEHAGCSAARPLQSRRRRWHCMPWGPGVDAADGLGTLADTGGTAEGSCLFRLLGSRRVVARAGGSVHLTHPDRVACRGLSWRGPPDGRRCPDAEASDGTSQQGATGARRFGLIQRSWVPSCSGAADCRVEWSLVLLRSRVYDVPHGTAGSSLPSLGSRLRPHCRWDWQLSGSAPRRGSVRTVPVRTWDAYEPRRSVPGGRSPRRWAGAAKEHWA